MSKYIAKYVFGEVDGLKFNKRNLKIALEDKGYKIIDTSLSGFKFIEKKNNIIKCSLFDLKKNKYLDYNLTLNEFWELTKNRKRHILLIKSF